MSEKNNISRRNFVGAVASASTVLLAGSTVATEEVLKDMPQDETVYYFGYGSNLNVKDTLGDLIPKGKFIMRAYLPNYEVQFRKWSNNYRGAISNIMEVPGEIVEAALYTCPLSDLEHLDYRIDYYVPEYKRELFKVLGEDNKWYQAFLYRLWEPKGPFPPSRRYVEGMLEGARDIKLNPEYIKKIEGFLRDSIVAPD